MKGETFIVFVNSVCRIDVISKYEHCLILLQVSSPATEKGKRKKKEVPSDDPDSDSSTKSDPDEKVSTTKKKKATRHKTKVRHLLFL